MTHKSVVDGYLEDRKVLASGFEEIISSTNEEHDNVNNPKHYTNGERETIEIIRDILGSEGFQDFCVGNMIKYVSRYKDKNGLEDIKKAEKYIEFLEDELSEEISC